jgi:hypothetical protein
MIFKILTIFKKYLNNRMSNSAGANYITHVFFVIL